MRTTCHVVSEKSTLLNISTGPGQSALRLSDRLLTEGPYSWSHGRCSPGAGEAAPSHFATCSKCCVVLTDGHTPTDMPGDPLATLSCGGRRARKVPHH